jgi:glycosyltransferase involved in cell wall biosynthesis
MRVLVVIPAYNEAATVADVALRACRYADCVIIVDDGSQDDTVERLEGLPVSVLRHERNRGKGASLWDGMQRAVADGASSIVTLDADGQHRPEDIPRLVAAARDHPERLIIAARSQKRGRAPKLRRFANGMADFWISWAAGCPIEDSQSGFRLYPAPLIRILATGHRPRHGFVFESEVLIEAARMGFRPMAVPIDTIYFALSRASYYRPITDTVRIVLMVAWKLISKGMYPQGLVRSLRRSRLDGVAQ